MVLSEELLELLLHITKNAAGAIFRFSDPVSLAVFPPGAGGVQGRGSFRVEVSRLWFRV